MSLLEFLCKSNFYTLPNLINNYVNVALVIPNIFETSDIPYSLAAIIALNFIAILQQSPYITKNIKKNLYLSTCYSII
ncbi:MAG: hypothetical protein K0R49_670 [Burkholderiales bacterium]|nr:hypothetical protein [Burkholderiales bacterium]